MKILDVNILLYAKFDLFPQHGEVLEWLERHFACGTAIGIPWETICGFLRIATNRKAISTAIPVSEAWEQVRLWLKCPTVTIPLPTDVHADVFDRLVSLGGMSSGLIPDAQLAALAMEHGATFVTCDGDFRRFPGIAVENPCHRL